MAYQEADGSISVYAVLMGTTYSSISLNIPESLQVITYPSPTSTTPTGSIVFDSSSSTYKPQFMVDAASMIYGNVSGTINANGSSSLLPYYA